ncbi:DUF3853 family protein [Echinicola marina]|uniref:DUF3853 family protein n=1 Tax=Echinicola marina TaxID=2859768 RepID=UPI001CF67EDE|nr:DUF3853 family protein [Echinicola marina]
MFCLNTKSSSTIKGLKGLANFLNCTLPTAQRYKSSGKIPFYQLTKSGTIYFDKDEVLKALKKGGQNG